MVGEPAANMMTAPELVRMTLPSIRAAAAPPRLIALPEQLRIELLRTIGEAKLASTPVPQLSSTFETIVGEAPPDTPTPVLPVIVKPATTALDVSPLEKVMAVELAGAVMNVLAAPATLSSCAGLPLKF